MSRPRTWLYAFLMGVVIGNGPASARADIQPGEVVTQANAQAVKDLVSPGVLWCVEHGMQMRIVPSKKIAWNQAYREATEKYASQVHLAADGRSLVGHVAGLPFPNLDPNDPQIAVKIMWNFDRKPFYTDDQDLRDFDSDTGPLGDGPMKVERHYIFDHMRTLFYTGRLYVPPTPVLVPNTDGVRAKSSLHPIIEPFDLKGVGLTGIRYLDPNRQDDTWLYMPNLRRVRRLSTAQRSDALFGQDLDADSIGGYTGQVAWFDWKFLGEKTMLASLHSTHFPVQYCEGSGDFAFCGDWEKRDVYVVEGTPKQPQYSYGKRIIFLDKETYVIPYSDLYDRAGRLWKVWISEFGFRTRAAPDYGIQYPDEMPFNHSVAMVDIQLQHATRIATPSAKVAGEQGWYFNQGEKTGLTEEFFTLVHLIQAGH